MNDRPTCGSCASCRTRTGHCLKPAHVVTLPGKRPSGRLTKERLLRHAQRFGWNGVAATAAEYGVAGVVEPVEPKARRPRARPIKDRVRELLSRGSSPESIAEALDTSPSRARRLIAEVEAEDV